MQQLVQPQFTFTEEGHIYTVDGKVRPHPTGILEDLGLTGLKNVDPMLLYLKSKFGTAGHEAVYKYEKGESLEDVDPKFFPYLAQYQQFKDTYGVETEEVEYMGYCEYWNFAFRLDQTAGITKSKYKGKRSIIEIKFGDYRPCHKLQVALYQIGWESLNPSKKIGVRIILELGESSFNPIFRTEETDKQAALSALIMWQWMKEERLL